jgi:outer membrane immunogenic protein
MLSTVALVALTGSALAGDLPSRKDVPVFTPPPFSWTGFYAGAELGAIFPTISGHGFSSTTTLGLGGGLVGYNYQVNPSFVIGLEGDGGGVFGSAHAAANVWSPYYSSTAVNSSYYADIRGRLGWAQDRALLYVAGGAAFGNAQTIYQLPWGSAPGITVNSSRTGWTIGGGLDYAFTDNWIGRVEYRYTNLGTENYHYTYVTDSVKAYSSQVLFAAIYKFGAPAAPIVAKY